MLKETQASLCSFVFLVSSCVGSQENLNTKVADFMQLLVRTDEPTLAEYAQYAGECGGESELDFMLNKCRANGWSIYSKSCVDFTRQRCRAAEKEYSLELSWLRERFSTAGESYKLINVKPTPEGNELVEVEIGKNKFLLFHDAGMYPPGGLVVVVSKVNGRKVIDYLKSK